MSISEKLTTVAKNVSKVYEAGQKSEYDKFWDNFQNYGNRTVYNSGFRSVENGIWNENNFYPKYDIKAVGDAQYLLYNWKSQMSLTQRLKECNVTLDTSLSTSLQSAFNYCYFTEIPTIDLRSTTDNSSGLFANAWGRLITIEKIIMNENTLISGWFNNDTGLKNLTIEGTIGQNGFNVSSCTKLSGESIVSIIEALSSTTSGLKVTLSQTAVDNMVFPIKGNKGTYNSWTELEQTKTNWTISLV